MTLKHFSHLQQGRLKCHIYHGQYRKDVGFLMEFDVVITTYHTVSSIWRKHNGQIENEKSIFSLYWHRVVLDEGREPQRLRLNTANSESSYYSKPTKSNHSSMLRSPLNATMGDLWYSHTKQARRFR